ncbi:hypothetical protein BVI2075_370077 [Burkholderia vietnamiensis]|nr:hypothetical protein BVI2075_370077 [Burkholderia vietnamiensis]CAG9229923.1 hypothetical protein BVI1335_700005 [Burkholderia vietnamiensis]
MFFAVPFVATAPRCQYSNIQTTRRVARPRRPRRIGNASNVSQLLRARRAGARRGR